MRKLIQLIINVFWVAMFVWAVFGLSSCGKNEPDKPEVATESDVEEAEENTEAFFEALEEQDFEKAEEFSTPDTRPVLILVKNDAKKYREKNGEPPEINIQIVDRKPMVNQVNLTVTIQIGDQSRKQVIKVIRVEDEWLVSMPKRQVAFLEFVVYYHRMDLIVVHEVKHKKHPRGHAYGHHKKKHNHDDDDD